MRGEAERRHEDALWAGVSRPTPVIAVVLAEDADDFEAVLEDFEARADDAFWARQVRRWPFTWQKFIDWWVARRFIVPRDVRKR